MPDVTDTPGTPSIAHTLRPVDAGEPVFGVHFLGGTPVFVLGDEALLFVGDSGTHRVVAHRGGILASAGDGKRIVTGGDDGRLVATLPDMTTSEIAADDRKRWIDQLALGPDGMVAWSAGKTAFVRDRKGEVKSLDLPSTVAGLAFAPKGFRLAIAHYNGASLWFPNAQAKPEFLEAKGSHLAIAFSPDGRFAVTAMQEPMMHGWRVVDGKKMRMSGYTTRVRSFGWLADGSAMATSGSEQLILWPFDGKDGPMGSRPAMWSPRDKRVVMVACHPSESVVATAYADGMVLLVQANSGAEVLARKPTGVPVTALGWGPGGRVLAFGDEAGAAGLVSI